MDLFTYTSILPVSQNIFAILALVSIPLMALSSLITSRSSQEKAVSVFALSALSFSFLGIVVQVADWVIVRRFFYIT